MIVIQKITKVEKEEHKKPRGFSLTWRLKVKAFDCEIGDSISANIFFARILGKLRESVLQNFVEDYDDKKVEVPNA